MAPRNPRVYVGIQWALLVISLFLTVATIVDLAQGATGSSLWIAVVCWPIVAIAAVVGIVRYRGQS